MNNYKIKNLNDEPTTESDGVNKNYVDSSISHSHVKLSYQKDQFSFLISNVLQLTDFIDGGHSFNMTKIADLSSSQGNFHSYNHKLIYTTIIKNSRGGYKYKMRINFYTLLLNVDYTLCIEILNTDYQLWHKAKFSVERATSQGLTVGNVPVKKFSHRYIYFKKQPEFMYYHRLITNFKKENSTKSSVFSSSGCWYSSSWKWFRRLSTKLDSKLRDCLRNLGTSVRCWCW